MTTGQRIKQRRLELNLTVDELANKLKKNRATIYRYEKDDIKDMPTTVLEPLASALETTPAYLMGWNDFSMHNTSKKTDISSSHMANTIKVSSKEESMIEKYRTIDDDGKKVVDTVLDREYERAIAPVLMAAHNDKASDPEELEKIYEDIMNLKRPE